MDDILASIRRVLNDGSGSSSDETTQPDVEVSAPPKLAAEPEPAAERDQAAAVSPDPTKASMGDLIRRLTSERTVQVSRSGPTLEDLVRQEMRPILRQWLDTHMPALVERLVRAEIERLIDRSAAGS